MSDSSIGRIFRVTTWGESHGPAIGAVIDGCPAGLSLSEELIQPWLDRRRPGQSRYATARAEADRVEILSGVFEGRTTGTPVSLMIRSSNQRSGDYSSLAGQYRPGHADYGYDQKYGFRDYRGGGRSSGRETAARVAAGAVASLLLRELGVTLTAYTRSIGPVSVSRIDPAEITRNSLCMPDAEAAARAEQWLDDCIKEQDSSGGIIECIASGMPAGAGSPVFGRLDAELAKAVMSIGAVKAVEIGDGLAAASAKGSENNDPFLPGGGKSSNHAGGILGGISDGSDIILRAAIKPTPSIARPQQTINRNGDAVTLEIHGRHDPVIVPRAVVVVEAMTAITLADALLTGMSSRLDNVKKVWGQGYPAV